MPLLLLALMVAVAPGTQPPATAQEPSKPLTNEDVVRMVVQGRPETEIRRIIDASPADFDLDREMCEELRRAGVTEKILAAMRERQAVAGIRPSASPPAPSPAAPRGTLRLSFAALEDSGKPAAPSFEMIKKIPRWAIQNMGMEEKAEVEDLALFVVCTTPDHVPDHWQDLTPVKEFTRHEMLRFHAGSHPDKSKKFEMLSLDLPASLDLEIPEGIHRLSVGVAAKIGTEWRAVTSDQRKDVPIQAGATTGMLVKLKGRLTGSSGSGFKEDQGLTIDRIDEPGRNP